MRQDIILKPWQIELTTNSTNDSFEESTFFTGNGRMGIRGYLPFWQEKRTFETGLFVAGIFGEIKPGITDFVNLPTPVWGNIECDGHPITLSSPVSSTLDMKTGVRSQSFLAKSGETTLNIEHQVFCSMSDPSLLVQRLSFSASRTSNISAHAGIHTACCNCPVPDDQVKENHETIKLAEPTQHDMCKDSVDCTFSILGTGLIVREQMSFHTSFSDSEDYISDDVLGKQWCGILQSGQKFVLEITTRITTSRDIDPLIGSNETSGTYDELLAKSSLAWASRWNESDIEIDGAPDDQSAVRYNIFQLITSCSARDSSVSIGARGLTHTRYKGCYFWDTDFFMLSFFLYSHPEAAKNLMEYRVRTLPQAKENAQKMNNAGARYPWMTSFDGSEQCESWDIGASELHITADIPFAMQQYFDATGDENFHLQAMEVYIETARFWYSRCIIHPDGSADLMFCKGPDEYCGITNNNLFTNCMVKFNLDLATKAALKLKETDSNRYSKLSLSDEEVLAWHSLRDNLKECRDPQTGRYLPDETFTRLEPVDIKTLKTDDGASYHHVCFDRLQRYQVIKQADTLLLMSRLPKKFTPEERLNAWEDFEPCCLHDSTLSFASHALFAAQNGLQEAAEKYFKKALYLDLHEIMNNTGKEGLHLACLGETWSSIFFGFLGATFDGDTPVFSPVLPSGWKGLRMNFYWWGELYRLMVSEGRYSISRI